MHLSAVGNARKLSPVSVEAGYNRGRVAMCGLSCDPAGMHWVGERLASLGWEAPQLERQGLLAVGDADATLGAFMVDGHPRAVLFEQVVGGLLDRVAENFTGRPVRAFGEMVDLLCQPAQTQADHPTQPAASPAGWPEPPPDA